MLLLAVPRVVQACESNAHKIHLSFVNNSSHAVTVEPLSKNFLLSIAPKTKHVSVMYAQQGPKSSQLDLEFTGAGIIGAFFFWKRTEIKNQQEKIEQVLKCNLKDSDRLPVNVPLTKKLKDIRACTQAGHYLTITFENNTIPTLSRNN